MIGCILIERKRWDRSAKIPITTREIIIPRKLYQQFLARNEKIFSFWIYQFSSKTSNKNQFTIHDHIVLFDIPGV